LLQGANRKKILIFQPAFMSTHAEQMPASEQRLRALKGSAYASRYVTPLPILTSVPLRSSRIIESGSTAVKSGGDEIVSKSGEG
jgi:hypothetical protein